MNVRATPRADAATVDDRVPAYIARQLERELNEALQDLALFNELGYRATEPSPARYIADAPF